MARRKGTRREARRHGLAGLTVLGAAVVAGVVAGWGIGPVEPAEISPADVVALRFPADWDEPTGSTPSTPAIPAGAYALASADSQSIDTDFAFSPHRTVVPGKTGWAPMSFADAQPRVASPTPRTAPAPEPAARPAPVAAARPEAQPEIRTASAVARAAPPAPQPTPHVRKDSGMMFSDAQLATIKHRLKLSGYQEQYWPPVASALRDIGQRVSHDAGHGGAHGAQARLAQIDPDGPEVQRLKSAAFPLIMSMNEDQKREVRTLAQVMGLQSVAASF